MTDREKAIVTAYTGICMLKGEAYDEFYKYLAELYGRPVYTHEIVTLDIKERSKDDFIELCRREEPERKRGEWTYIGGGEWQCSNCGDVVDIIGYDYCPNCGSYNGCYEHVNE